jgi:hypothetical protein
VIYRDSTSNRVVLATSATSVGATCTKVGTEFGSPQVAITSLTFSPETASVAARKATRRFDVTVTGHLIDQDAELNSVSRTLTQSVYVRSIAGSN